MGGMSGEVSGAVFVLLTVCVTTCLYVKSMFYHVTVGYLHDKKVATDLQEEMDEMFQILCIK